MKIILLMLFLVTAGMVRAQAPINHTMCDNESNTDWTNANNNMLPWQSGQYTGTPADTPDERFLNRFNWVNGDNPNGNYTLDNMYLTFGTPYGQMTNIHPDPAPIQFYMYLYERMLMSPENGWELLQFNLGRYPDATVHSFTNLQYLPYIILYNRYSNIIRVFVTYGQNEPPEEAIDGVKIDLSLLTTVNGVDNLSGIFRLGAGMDRTLDQTTSSSQLSAVAKNPGFENLWYSADFQIAYDPCTCEYPSILNFEFSFFSETDFELVGNALTGNDVDMATAQELIANDFIGNFEWSNNQAQNGFIIYDNLSKAVDDYLERLDKYETELAAVNEYNAEIKRQKAILSVFKSIILTATNPTSLVYAGISLAALANNEPALATEVQTHAPEIIKNDTLHFREVTDKTKSILTGAYNFLITKQFKDKPKPDNKPEQPSISYTQMKFEGRLYDDLDMGGTDFMNPGAFDNTDQAVNNYLWSSTAQENSPYKFPIYNDVLGTFALLEKPKVKYTRKVLDLERSLETITLPIYSGLTVLGIHQYNYRDFRALFSKWNTNYQFQIAEDLKYAINTNLDIKDYDVKIGFVIEPKKTSTSAFVPETDHVNVVDIQSNTIESTPIYSKNQQVYKSPDLTIGMTSVNTGDNSFLWGGMNYGEIESIYNTCLTDNTLFKIDYATNQQGQSAINIGPKYDSSRYETSLVSKDYFKDAVYSLGLRTEMLEHWGGGIPLPQQHDPESFGFDGFEIKLKIRVDIEFESLNERGENNTSTHTFTYKVDASDITLEDDAELLPNINTNPLSVLTEVEDEAYFDDLHFSGQNVPGCHLANGVYTCQAWDVLNIVGDITTAPGYSVNFYAGNEVIALPESSITPGANGDIVLEINNVYTPNPMLPASASYVSDFCTGANPEAPSYQANIPTGKESESQESDEQSNDEPKIGESALALHVYPVPTSNMITLAFSQGIDDVAIEIYDLAGRIVPSINVERQQDSLYTVDVSFIEPGTYNVVARTGNATFSKRIIIL